MISKTWLIGFVASMLLQYAPKLTEYTPNIIEFMLKYVPGAMHDLVTGVVPVVISWVTAMTLTWARNDASKKAHEGEGTVASPLTGAKALWRK